MLGKNINITKLSLDALTIASSMLAMMLANSCQRDGILNPGGNVTGDAVVGFVPELAAISVMDMKSGLDDGETISTGSDVFTRELKSEDGNVVVPFSCTVSPGRKTKGALINDSGTEMESLSKFLNIVDKFYVSSWTVSNEKDTDNIPPYGEVQWRTKDAKGVPVKKPYWMTVQKIGDLTYDKEYIWKDREYKIFYAYANLPAGAEVSNTDGTSETPTMDCQTLNITSLPSDAKDQKDILLGFYYGDGRVPTEDGFAKHIGMADIEFIHPMVAVQFKVGTITGIKSISGISIENICMAGKASHSYDKRIAIVPKYQFKWIEISEPGAVSQTFDDAEDLSPGTELGEPFILIPQKLNYDVQLNLDVTFNDGTSTTLTSFLGPLDFRMPGATVTCTIGYDSESAGF